MEEKIFKKSAIFLLASFLFLIGFWVEAAVDYAPNLWFDSQEKYYPANPLDFYFENGQEIEGEKAVQKYNQLSLEDKLNNLTVFYHIQDEGYQWVYQYWFFYVFNDYQKGIKNKHYGDWESVFVFVDKDSGQVNKVIGTAHQRKIFDTEIYNPETNHIWSYVGNGSHANCIDEKDDGYCDFYKWRSFEKWDKKGPEISFNDYNLIKIDDNFINNFNGAITLEKSPELGIETNLLKPLGISRISLGGSPSIYAWEQSSFNNPEEIRPISIKLVTEYISSKFNQTKNKVVGFFNDFFDKIGPTEQQAGIIVSSIEEPQEIIIKPVIEIKQKIKQETIVEPIIEPVIEEVVEVIEEEIVEVEEIAEPEPDPEPIKEIVPSPIGPPPFIGGGGAFIPPEPEPEPEIIDTIPPSDITDLSAGMGSNRGEINLSWTAPDTATQYIIKYATSSGITDLTWASSTDITTEPSPSLASSTESLTISNLDVNQTYYWAIKSEDEEGNLSELSNSASSSPYAQASSLVISEVQIDSIDGAGGTSDDFIELYNPTNSDIYLNGYRLVKRTETGILDTSIKSWSNDLEAKVPAHGFYLWANSGYTGINTTPDATTTAIISANNGIALRSGPQDTGLIIDSLGWGNCQNEFVEGNAAIDLSGAQSLERKNQTNSTALFLAVSGNEHWQGNNWDGDNNSQDFVLQATTSPQNSLSLTEPRTSFASLADTDWPMFQGNISHTGLSSYSGNATGSPTSTPKWTTTLSTPGPMAPTIGPDGFVYIGTGSGILYKISTTGATSTFYNVGVNGAVEASAFASDGTIYMTDRKHLYALTSDGQAIWKYPVYGFSAPAIASDGTIYIASDYYLYALTPNGEKIWQSPLLSNARWIMSPVIDSSGNIYTVGKVGSCSACQIVYALNPLDGSIVWQTNPGSYYTALSLDTSGVLYVGSFSGSSGFYAINSSNGSQKWYAPIGNIIESVPAINQDVIYVGTYNDGIVYAIDRTNGSTNWSYYLGGKISAAPIIDNQGVIYIGSKNNMFYAINSDGSLRWLAELSDEVQYSAVIDSNGVIYVGVADGNIYAFRE